MILKTSDSIYAVTPFTNQLTFEEVLGILNLNSEEVSKLKDVEYKEIYTSFNFNLGQQKIPVYLPIKNKVLVFDATNDSVIETKVEDLKVGQFILYFVNEIFEMLKKENEMNQKGNYFVQIDRLDYPYLTNIDKINENKLLMLNEILYIKEETKTFPSVEVFKSGLGFYTIDGNFVINNGK